MYGAPFSFVCVQGVDSNVAYAQIGPKAAVSAFGIGVAILCCSGVARKSRKHVRGGENTARHGR